MISRKPTILFWVSLQPGTWCLVSGIFIQDLPQFLSHFWIIPEMSTGRRSRNCKSTFRRVVSPPSRQDSDVEEQRVTKVPASREISGYESNVVFSKEEIVLSPDDEAAQQGTSFGSSHAEQDRESEGEVSDDLSTGASVESTGTKPKSKKHIGHYTFSTDLAKWYRENPCLFNKKHRDFKNASIKRRLIEEKAASLTLTCSHK